MGVKRYFVFISEAGSVHTGPAAFYELRRLYKRFQELGYLEIPLNKLRIPEGGWRRQILVLYQHLQKGMGKYAGILKELRIQNPRSDQQYRDALAQIGNPPRPQTPPTEGR